MEEFEQFSERMTKEASSVSSFLCLLTFLTELLSIFRALYDLAMSSTSLLLC